MQYLLEKLPTIKGENNELIPYGINYPLSIFLAELLENNISNDNPLLEYRISKELRETNSCELNNDEVTYIKSLIERFQINNILKGQLLEAIPSVLVN